MSNLYEIQRQRLKIYGEMLKKDLNQRRSNEKIQREASLKRDSEELQRHIQQTKRYDHLKKMQQKQFGHALREENKMLTTFKNSILEGSNYAEVGQSFVANIHALDNQRLYKLKSDLSHQLQDNRQYISQKKAIQDQINEIEKLQAQRHTNRVKQMQNESIKNYEQIKRKHQQDMNIYEKHKLLMEENDHYREEIEGFTKGKGMLDRYNRNDYFQRRASQVDNQNELIKQMAQFDRKKKEETYDYKMKIGNLQDSMLGSVLLPRPPKVQPKSYSNELKIKMQEDTMRRLEQKATQKQKVQLNNIYGGVHGNQRQKMLQIIDRRLGIDRYNQIGNSPTKKRELIIQTNNTSQNNPETMKLSESKRYLTPRSSKQMPNNKLDTSQQITLPQLEPSYRNGSQYIPSQMNSSQNKRSFKSYDFITGKNRFYGVD